MRRETVNVRQEWLNRINITTAFERYQTNLFAWNEKGKCSIWQMQRLPVV